MRVRWSGISSRRAFICRNDARGREIRWLYVGAIGVWLLSGTKEYSCNGVGVRRFKCTMVVLYTVERGCIAVLVLLLGRVAGAVLRLLALVHIYPASLLFSGR